jgi:NADH-quinone oxidoreductase subunit C
LSSADTAAPDAGAPEEAVEEHAPRDERLEGILGVLRDELGDAVVESHIRPGDDLWVRVTRESWVETARVALHSLRCEYFEFLSAIDWLPSPFGRDMDSQEDIVVHGRDEKEPPPMATGYAGGDTRFQVFARVFSVEQFHGVNFKVDLPDDDLTVDSWVPVFAGANWHERECFEMYGISFNGHPYLRKLYLPGDFEGYPLRKDFPLLARRVKPWPGIVDVEPMPGGTDDDEEEGGEE